MIKEEKKEGKSEGGQETHTHTHKGERERKGRKEDSTNIAIESDIIKVWI